MDWLKDFGILESNYKWIYVLSLLIGSFLALIPLQKLLIDLKSRFTIKNEQVFARALIALKIEKPLVGIILTVIWQSALELIDFPAPFEKGLGVLIQIFQALFLIQLAYQVCDAIGLWMEVKSNHQDSSVQRQLVPMVRKSLKILVVLLGTLSLIQGLGFNVVSLLAGLGLGGLALALAAQDTAANVFGSIMILLDKPFKIGDYVKIADTEGTIEDVGFRSTRIRTNYKSLVTIPNSTVAKEKIDNLSERTLLRVRHVFGLTYSASPLQIQNFSEEVRHELQLNPMVSKDDLQVSFQNMGDFSLQIAVQFFVHPLNPADLGAFQQDFLLQVMKIALKNQVEFAFPTQTLHVESRS